MNPKCHNTGQERNLGREIGTLKRWTFKRKFYMTQRLIIYRGLHVKGLNVRVATVRIMWESKDWGPRSTVSYLSKTETQKLKVQQQNQGLRDPVHVACILFREAPGFQKSRSVYREIRQNTAGDASWNLLCFIHASLADGSFPGGGWISQGSDVRGNK